MDLDLELKLELCIITRNYEFLRIMTRVTQMLSRWSLISGVGVGAVIALGVLGGGGTRN